MLKHSLVALAAMSAGLLGLPASQASAFTVQQQPTVQTEPSQMLTEVRHNNNRRHGNQVYYDRRRHGDRCGSWSRHCSNYYRGYYYENPWWVLPLVGAGIALSSRDRYDDGYGYGSRHVQWCMDRYRSYNVRTNTWVSYSGRVHQCVSPYGP